MYLMQRQRACGNTPVICDITLLNHDEKVPPRVSCKGGDISAHMYLANWYIWPSAIAIVQGFCWGEGGEILGIIIPHYPMGIW